MSRINRNVESVSIFLYCFYYRCNSLEPSDIISVTSISSPIKIDAVKDEVEDSFGITRTTLKQRLQKTQFDKPNRLGHDGVLDQEAEAKLAR